MAKPKTDPDKNWLKDLMKREAEKRANTPIVAERWYVVDFYPSRRDSDEYSDFWTRQYENKASRFFETLAEAEKFVEEHEPEPGAELKIRHQNKRVITTEEWVNW